MSPFLLILIFFLAAFSQSLTGFGAALIAMALLPALVGIKTAAPLVAIFALTIEIIVLARYYHSLKLRALLPVFAASIIGIPLGIWALKQADEKVVLPILGGIILAYAVFSLMELKLPELHHPAWAYLVGLIAGLLGGAFNTSGPPLVIYGNARRWLPQEFKSNLQSFFLLNSTLVTIGHAMAGNFTPQVWQIYLWALPAIAAGIISGIFLDRYIQPNQFRKIVLWMLVGLGVKLIL